MHRLKYSKRVLVVLIALDIFMAIGSNIVDWPILTYVDWYLIPFAPICSLYPLTLAIWFFLYYKGWKIPAWYTTFIFVGIVAYGVMAQIYYPVFIYFEGLHWNLVGNMVWVALYAIQALIIKSELRPLKYWQYAIIISYFLFKDFSDRYMGTFTDVIFFDFTEFSKDSLFVLILLLHTFSMSLALNLAFKHYKYRNLKPVPHEQGADFIN